MIKIHKPPNQIIQKEVKEWLKLVKSERKGDVLTDSPQNTEVH